MAEFVMTTMPCGYTAPDGPDEMPPLVDRPLELPPLAPSQFFFDSPIADDNNDTDDMPFLVERPAYMDSYDLPPGLYPPHAMTMTTTHDFNNYTFDSLPHDSSFGVFDGAGSVGRFELIPDDEAIGSTSNPVTSALVAPATASTEPTTNNSSFGCFSAFNAENDDGGKKARAVVTTSVGGGPVRNASHAKKRERDSSYVPRPPNAFILFRSSFIKSQQIPEKIEGNHSTLSKIIGLVWKSLPAPERAHWESKAQFALEAHRARYPNWRFSLSDNAAVKEREREREQEVLKERIKEREERETEAAAKGVSTKYRDRDRDRDRERDKGREGSGGGDGDGGCEDRQESEGGMDKEEELAESGVDTDADLERSRRSPAAVEKELVKVIKTAALKGPRKSRASSGNPFIMMDGKGPTQKRTRAKTTAAKAEKVKNKAAEKVIVNKAKASTNERKSRGSRRGADVEKKKERAAKDLEKAKEREALKVREMRLAECKEERIVMIARLFARGGLTGQELERRVGIWDVEHGLIEDDGSYSSRSSTIPSVATTTTTQSPVQVSNMNPQDIPLTAKYRRDSASHSPSSSDAHTQHPIPAPIPSLQYPSASSSSFDSLSSSAPSPLVVTSQAWSQSYNEYGGNVASSYGVAGLTPYAASAASTGQGQGQEHQPPPRSTYSSLEGWAGVPQPHISSIMSVTGAREDYHDQPTTTSHHHGQPPSPSTFSEPHFSDMDVDFESEPGIAYSAGSPSTISSLCSPPPATPSPDFDVQVVTPGPPGPPFSPFRVQNQSMQWGYDPRGYYGGAGFEGLEKCIMGSGDGDGDGGGSGVKEMDSVSVGQGLPAMVQVWGYDNVGIAGAY